MSGDAKKRFVIVGGGIAAVCCTERLAAENPDDLITVVAGSNIVKAVIGWRKFGKAMEEFEVEQKPGTSAFESLENVTLISSTVIGVEPESQILITESGLRIGYDYLCIATGGKPKMISSSKFVVGIRDTQTVADFQQRLKGARRIVVIGNGGIATELVFELRNIEVVWAVKHKSIASTFVDAGAGEFFMASLNSAKDYSKPSKRLKYTDIPNAKTESNSAVTGSALGPDWCDKFELSGNMGENYKNVSVEFECELKKVIESERIDEKGVKWPVTVQLTSGKEIGCDLIVSATGVDPNTDVWRSGFGTRLEVDSDGGILVNDQFQTSIPNVFAAGDVCTANWEHSPHWLQMRLWTQARQMGAFCGHCMANSSRGLKSELDICFEIFTHVTTFFGFKVILLGRFNSQGLDPEKHEALLRIKKGDEYVKVLLLNGRVQGAVLIGETDLEETLENLILNQTDVTEIKDGLLDPSVDIEDYFD